MSSGLPFRRWCSTAVDRAVRIGAGRHLAEHIPQALFIELDGADHWAFADDQQAALDSIRRFVGGLPR
jgi:hypothetical protein